MENFKVNIPNPCKKEWNKMQPKENGRFCDSCDKTVVDFRSMTTEEIKSFFAKNSGQKTCGHFKVSQTSHTQPILHQFLTKLYEIVDSRFHIRILKTSMLFIISIIMTLVGCQPEVTGKKVKSSNDTIIIKPGDSSVNYNTILGEPMEIHNDSTRKE